VREWRARDVCAISQAVDLCFITLQSNLACDQVWGWTLDMPVVIYSDVCDTGGDLWRQCLVLPQRGQGLRGQGFLSPGSHVLGTRSLATTWSRRVDASCDDSDLWSCWHSMHGCPWITPMGVTGGHPRGMYPLWGRGQVSWWGGWRTGGCILRFLGKAV